MDTGIETGDLFSNYLDKHWCHLEGFWLIQFQLQGNRQIEKNLT